MPPRGAGWGLPGEYPEKDDKSAGDVAGEEEARRPFGKDIARCRDGFEPHPVSVPMIPHQERENLVEHSDDEDDDRAEEEEAVGQREPHDP